MTISRNMSLLFAVALFSSTTAIADEISEDSASTMSCGTNFISVGDPVSALLRTCGEPDSRDGNRWTYSNNPGSFIYQLDVTDGNILSINTYDKE